MTDAFGDLDLAALGRALSYPGIDPRIWVSYGIVDREQDDQKSTVFDDDYGPMVWVILQPHNQRVLCRVGHQVAGNGESDWHPFMQADEVLVVVPEGDTRSYPVIVCRLNNSFDKFPKRVGVQETANNDFGFRRTRGPYVHECDSAITFRSSGGPGKPSATFGIDALGNVTIVNGNMDVIQLGALGPVMKTGDGLMQVALDDTKKEATVVAGSAMLTLSDTAASEIFCQALKLSACGNMASEHLVTLEQVVNILASLLTNLTTGAGMGFLVGPPGTGFPTRVAALAAISGALNAIAVLPITPALPGITAALQIPKPLATSAGQPMPGVGCAGLLGA